MTDAIRAAHNLLREHATESDNTELAETLRKFAVANEWEEPSVADVVAKIHL